MRIKRIMVLTMAVLLLSWFYGGVADPARADHSKPRYLIIASDTLLSGMAEALLPPNRYAIDAILPPGQCPGHYDVKLSDIEKIKKADLVIAFSGMPFVNKMGLGGRAHLFVDAGNRNWMAPDSYIYGLNRLADEISVCFPEDRNEIHQRKEAKIREVKKEASLLQQMIRRTDIAGRPVLASAMQKESLEWMGFRVAGVYGRPEAMSTKNVVSLLKIGKDQQVVAVVDNLQSGPDAGKSIAETLKKPHIVLTNFPTEQGYLATLKDNVNKVLAAMGRK